MTTLRQRLARKKNRKLRRLRELYPDIRIKLFYARDFRAMMLKYGRLGLAESLSGTPGQVVPDRGPVVDRQPAQEPASATPQAVQPSADRRSGAPLPGPRATTRSRQGRRRRGPGAGNEAGAEREAGA
jgi:hypothetical protein